MIEIKNLTKTYNNSKFEVEAIKHLNIKFKDNGFVFIVGKSGCGKSTLLNLMGGLDEVTDGDIICDGNHLVKMKEKELNNFRNNYLGFVFQDYCLIEDLTVYENIALALDIKGGKLSKENRDKLVFDALKSVELDVSMANRKMKELSGGQKQRVSIARTLIKNPKLILADEPTGNLDSKTTKTILELLKELSKNRLVIIVSHNMEDARIYADRIIELSDGEVVSDIERTGEDIASYTMQNGELTLPSFTRLTEEELVEINTQLQSNKITKISQHSDGFEKTKDIEVTDRKIIITSNKMSGKNSLKLANKFLKKRWFAGIFTIFSIILLVFMLGMCQFLTQFDSTKTIAETMIENGETQILAHKGYYDEDNDKEVFNKYIEISDSEIQKFVDAGYTGGIHKLWRDSFAWISFMSDGDKRVDDSPLMKGQYIGETYGTLQCTEDYMIKNFGINGEVEYLALSSRQEPGGIIITDYIADCVINSYSDETYESLVELQLVCDRKHVNGIIKTDYKEKHAEAIKFLEDVYFGRKVDKTRNEMKPQLIQFMYDVKMYYGLAYTTNPDYATAVRTLPEDILTHTIATGFELYINDQKMKPNNLIIYDAGGSGIELGPNQIVVEYDIFNKMFGETLNITYTAENYTDFEPMVIKFLKPDGTPKREPIKYYNEFTIVKLVDKNVVPWSGEETKTLLVSDDVYQALHNLSIEVHGLMFDDISQIGKISTLLEDYTYSISSRVYKHIKNVGDIVNVFMELFGLLLFVVALICLLLLVNYGYGNIRKRYQEIGIMKALGASTKNVGFIFGLQTILAGVVISVISTLMLIFLCGPINLQLSNRMLSFIGNAELGTLEILKPNALTIVINICVISVITAISSIIPVRKIHKIKPRQIINNK